MVGLPIAQAIKVYMDLSILSPASQAEAEALMKEIGVDPGGLEIMSPKTVLVLARINKLSVFAANILKQETLSLGADTAVSRNALSGKAKWTDCLVIGNLAHIKRLCEKLKKQPYGLSRVAGELESALINYQRNDFVLNLNRDKLNLNSHTHIMGIINITPDSFSGDGLLRKTCDVRRATCDVVEYAQKLVAEGADILDIGGESSRPGARPVSLKAELERVIPALKAIRKKIRIPISIDTYKSEVARQALDNGADIINDITALHADLRMAKVVKRYKAAVVLMHMQGKPPTMQKNPGYGAVMEEIITYLGSAIKKALDNGIDLEKIILDPGIGFGKRPEHNLKIIKSLKQLKVLGRPILIGASRKSFIAAAGGGPLSERVSATIGSNALAVVNGAKILRVHDVKEAKMAFSVIDRILQCQ